ncbi:MAG TPA: cyclic nucleotide-binding domain-containing protein [Steroidobacteraceae bacterium]|nr:cyclic nucleotide-binding domain-containing protein [Steroidobacteraceae bacterium]
MSEGRPADVPLLRKLSPLGGMKNENIAALARKVRVSELAANRTLFKEGDSERRCYWLISGMLDLREGDRTVAMIRGGTPEAKNQLSPKLPRRATARAVDAVEYIVVDADLLDMMITWDQTGTYEVSELQAQFGTGGSDDWMTTLLQTKAFHRIPPANIQAIFMRMQRVACRTGEVIIRQGTEGDFFYAIVSGKCVVTRETPLNREGIRLAELTVGETFGEEALISEAKRNATVAMLTDGVLMRLSKEDFRELMNEPLQQWVDYAGARAVIDRGGRWLDVRLPSEFQNLAIEGALNIPLYFIRLKLATLDRKIPYVVYCDTGRRSSAGAFILLERGFDAYVLKGGLSSAEPELRRPG